MAGGQSQDRSEKPTSKKLRDAREKGNVAQSREIPSVAVLSSSLGVLFFAGPWMLDELIALMRGVYNRAGGFSINMENLHSLFWEVFKTNTMILAPLMLVVLTVGVVSNVSQFGFMIIGEKLTPDFTKINPLNGFKRLFSSRSIVELLKSMIKLVIVGGILYAIVNRYTDQIPGIMHLSVGGILNFICHVSFQLVFYTCIVLAVMAALDFAYNKWKHQHDLMMTKQEVKDEYKQREGDPKIKARIRSAQREMARRRMMEAIPEATVVITNPTHLAIALKYEDGMPAPQIVAKGAGFVAQKIRELAAENDVPLVENKPLARTLYKVVEIGGYIPADLYKAVAEVLAYVYRLRGMAGANG